MELPLASPEGSTVLPGDLIAEIPAPQPRSSENQTRAVVRLGSGVARGTGLSVISTRAGKLQYEPRRTKLWIDSNHQRYDPIVGDAVIGVVVDRHADEYRLEIAGTDTAALPSTAFEGATKRNKPALVVGSTVYCRITRASKEMEYEASCVEPGSSRSWVSGETLYGELKQGNTIEVSLPLARQMQTEKSEILDVLARSGVKFESAVGANGRVWLKGGSTRSTVLLCLLVLKADQIDLITWKEHVARVLKEFKP